MQCGCSCGMLRCCNSMQRLCSCKHDAEHAGYFHRDRETGIWSLRMEPWACAKRYLLGWASLDVVSVIPFDLILMASPSLTGSMGNAVMRLPRCLKLLRLPRLFRRYVTTPHKPCWVALHGPWIAACRMLSCSACCVRPPS
jgi:hypothetical protein